MANTKISALSSATTPLSGSEIVPVNQSGVTDSVSVANLTAGRAVSAASLALTTSPLPTTSGGTNLTSFTSNGVVYASSTSALATSSAFTFDGTNVSFTGNLIQGTSGKGHTTSGSFSLGLGTNGSTSQVTISTAGVLSVATNDALINGITVGLGATSGGSTNAISTVLGYQALSSNTSGQYNTAVGYQALKTNTTGQGNVGYGVQSLYGNTSGNYNTAVGAGVPGVSGSALGNNTTGSYNTALGNSCALSMQTGSNNIYIGYLANSSSSSVSNEIVLAVSASGKGANTAYVGGSSGAYNGANSTLWSVTSDQRIKKNIVDNNTGLDVINKIQVRNFEYRLPDEITDLPQDQAIAKTGVQLGVVAQELQKVLPECVKTESTGVMTVDADPLTWYLINAVKELSNRIEQLEAKKD
jgi:hypothetical protein